MRFRHGCDIVVNAVHERTRVTRRRLYPYAAILATVGTAARGTAALAAAAGSQVECRTHTPVDGHAERAVPKRRFMHTRERQRGRLSVVEADRAVAARTACAYTEQRRARIQKKRPARKHS
eukprot:1998779-Pleurochrysis_carterae.AAC.1